MYGGANHKLCCVFFFQILPNLHFLLVLFDFLSLYCVLLRRRRRLDNALTFVPARYIRLLTLNLKEIAFYQGGVKVSIKCLLLANLRWKTPRSIAGVLSNDVLFLECYQRYKSFTVDKYCSGKYFQTNDSLVDSK